MILLDQFNDKIADANQSIFDGTYDKFPGLFELNEGLTGVNISNGMGIIRFDVIMDTSFSVLKVFLKYKSHMVINSAYKDQFEKIVENFKD